MTHVKIIHEILSHSNSMLTQDQLRDGLSDGSIVLYDGNYYLRADAEELQHAEKQEEHYDLLQLTKKIQLNSLYGALLNPAFRFGDERMGASVTATGRAITTHMIETIAWLLTGERAQLVKTTQTDADGVAQHSYTIDSPAVVYSDTDSCYYKCLGATTREEAVEIADAAADGVNQTFPQFMRSAFNCQHAYDNLIKAGREIVASRALFQAKKKYICKVVDSEGTATNKIKSQGSEIKKADTPKIIQKFLKATVDMILDGRDHGEIVDFVLSQRRAILKDPANQFMLGVAKQVNNLDKYTGEYANPGTFRTSSGARLTIPGHVRAACNYNFLLGQFDPAARPIRGGDKVLVFYLAKNTFGFDSIAIPAEAVRFPKWFEGALRIDIKKTEDRMFDSKLGGIFSALGRDVPTLQSVLVNRVLEF